jgi:hypothetical protein
VTRTVTPNGDAAAAGLPSPTTAAVSAELRQRRVEEQLADETEAPEAGAISSDPMAS